MKKLISGFIIAILISVFGLSCSSDDNTSNNNGEEKHTGAISGFVQKGQFIKGSNVTIYALDHNLTPTGLSYPTQTTDDLGSFSISNISAEFLDIKVNGYYFNENTKATSESTINLQAIAAANTKVNVNLLTTLAYNRIKYLVSTGLKFTDAQNRAQIEVLTALGLGNSTSINFVDMNIAGSGDANGLLLAASLLIQQDRSVGNVSKLISDIASDIEQDGMLSSDLYTEIHKNERNIDLTNIINGLMEFYAKNKVEVYSIPSFFKFLDSDGDGRMDGLSEYIFKDIDYAEVYYHEPGDPNPGYSASGFSLTKHFVSTIPFSVSSDASWLSVEKRVLTDNIFTVDIVAQPNTGENRTAHVVYTDLSGKQLLSYTYQQKAPEELVPYRLFFQCSSNFEYVLKEKVGVNGKIYNLSKLENDEQYLYGFNYYIEIDAKDKQNVYQSYFPVRMLSMPDGLGRYKLTIPDYFTNDDIPFISISDRTDNNYNYSAPIGFVLASPVIIVDVIAGDPANIIVLPSEGNIPVIEEKPDYFVLTSEDPIVGSATYNVYTDGSVNLYNSQIDPSSLIPDNEGHYKAKVKILHHDGTSRYIIPVLIANAKVDIQLFNSEGKELLCVSKTSQGYYSSLGNSSNTRMK